MGVTENLARAAGISVWILLSVDLPCLPGKQGWFLCRPRRGALMLWPVLHEVRSVPPLSVPGLRGPSRTRSGASGPCHVSPPDQLPTGGFSRTPPSGLRLCCSHPYSWAAVGRDTIPDTRAGRDPFCPSQVATQAASNCSPSPSPSWHVGRRRPCLAQHSFSRSIFSI